MKTLKLTKAWTYRTPQITTPYPAGEHQVSNEVYAAALEAGATTEEKADGGGARATGAASGTGEAKK